jgi:N-methylhydantoinase A
MMSVQIDDADTAAELLRGRFAQLDEWSAADVADATRRAAVVFRRSADVRYRGQTHELTITVPGDAIGSTTVADIRESFYRLHHDTFGVGSKGPIEIISLRVQATLPVAHARFSRRLATAGNRADPAVRSAWFGGALIDTPVFAVEPRRDAAPVNGPALFETPEATVLVPVAWTAAVTNDGAVILQHRGVAHG